MRFLVKMLPNDRETLGTNFNIIVNLKTLKGVINRIALYNLNDGLSYRIYDFDTNKLLFEKIK